MQKRKLRLREGSELSKVTLVGGGGGIQTEICRAPPKGSPTQMALPPPGGKGKLSPLSLFTSETSLQLVISVGRRFPE